MVSKFVEWIETTSFEGVSIVFNSKSKIWQLAWSVILLALMAVSIQMTCEVMQSYIDAPLSVGLTTKINATLKLPEIAICSMQTIDVQKLRDAGLSTEAVRNLYFWFQHLELAPLYTNLNRNTFKRIRSELETFINQTNLTNFDGLLSFSLVKCEQIFHVVHAPGTGGPIDVCRQGLRNVAHQDLGPCYVLPSVEQLWPSYNAGWSMLLKIPPVHPLVEDLQVTRGFVIGFGQKYIVQSGDDYMIPVNKSVVVGLELTHTQKVEHRKWPRGKKLWCLQVLNNLSVNHCYYFHYMKALHQACGCAFYGLKNVVTGNNYPVCLFDLDCTVNRTIFQKKIEEECRPPCDEWTYSARITLSELNVARILENPALAGYEAVTELRISYPQLRYTHIEEQDDAGIESLVSNVGGMFGLWVGFSMFSIVHLVVYALAMITHFFHGLPSKRKTANLQLQKTMAQDTHILY